MRWLAISALALCAAHAATTGAMTCTVRDAVTSAGLDQTAGSMCDDFDTTNTLDLVRVSTSYTFRDGVVNAQGGYAVTAWATDYIPQTTSNITVSASSTTVVPFYLNRPVLSLSISPTSISEAGGTAIATVTLRDGSGNAVTLRNDVSVTAASNNTTKATVTQQATIAAGSSSTTFTVSGVDNLIHDGNIVVTISVSSGSWGSASQGVTIIDND